MWSGSDLGAMPRSGAAVMVCAVALALAACERGVVVPTAQRPETEPPKPASNPSPQATVDPYQLPRDEMVRVHLTGQDIADPRVLAAMGKVPRHRFVPAEQLAEAYADTPLSIGLGQTISQPYVVAFMTQALRLEGDERALEIGTGSGYQAAVLAELCREVYSIEIIPELSARAGSVLAELGYANIRLKLGDGYRGWPEEAPFDAIIVTAAPDHVPEPLVHQLAPGGRMIVPVGGGDYQNLVLIERTADGLTRREVLPVTFVPMTGEALRK